MRKNFYKSFIFIEVEAKYTKYPPLHIPPKRRKIKQNQNNIVSTLGFLGQNKYVH